MAEWGCLSVRSHITPVVTTRGQGHMVRWHQEKRLWMLQTCRSHWYRRGESVQSTQLMSHLPSESYWLVTIKMVQHGTAIWTFDLLLTVASFICICTETEISSSVSVRLTLDHMTTPHLTTPYVYVTFRTWKLWLHNLTPKTFRTTWNTWSDRSEVKSDLLL